VGSKAAASKAASKAVSRNKSGRSS
jgi:hypothetical protein